jgi:hypothetical protein
VLWSPRAARPPRRAAAACAPNGASTTAAATSGASASTTATGDEPTGGTTGDACLGSGDCDTEGICVADYDPERRYHAARRHARTGQLRRRAVHRVALDLEPLVLRPPGLLR